MVMVGGELQFFLFSINFLMINVYEFYAGAICNMHLPRLMPAALLLKLYYWQQIVFIFHKNHIMRRKFQLWLGYEKFC